MSRHHDRLAERQRHVEHAGLVDLAVGQADHVGAPEAAREPRARPGNAVHEADARRRRAACRGSIGHSAAGRRSTAPRPRSRANAPQQHVDALVRADGAEAQDHRPLDRRQLGRQRRSSGSWRACARTRRGGSPARARAPRRRAPQLARRRGGCATTTASILAAPRPRRRCARSTLWTVITRGRFGWQQEAGRPGAATGSGRRRRRPGGAREAQHARRGARAPGARAAAGRASRPEPRGQRVEQLGELRSRALEGTGP